MLKATRREVWSFFLITFVIALAFSSLERFSTSEKVSAQVSQGVAGLDAYDFETLSVTSATAVALTTAKLNPTNQPSAKAVFFSVATATVNYRFDGTAPTTTVGHAAPSAYERTLVGINNLTKVRFIAQSTTAPVTVTYLR